MNKRALQALFTAGVLLIVGSNMSWTSMRRRARLEAESGGQADELHALRAEIAALRADNVQLRSTSGSSPPPSVSSDSRPASDTAATAASSRVVVSTQTLTTATAAATAATAAAAAAATTSTTRASRASRAAIGEDLAAACDDLAPAVAVRPAPSGSLSSQLAVSHGPWRWAGSEAALTFDKDGLRGALETPWGDGRWGEASPGLLWADWSGRTHLLRVRASLLSSHRCGDGELLEATATASVASPLVQRACAAAPAAPLRSGACASLVRRLGWRSAPDNGRRMMLEPGGKASSVPCTGASGGPAAADCSGTWRCVAPDVAEARLDDAPAPQTVRLLAHGREVVGVSCSGSTPSMIFFDVAVTNPEDEEDEEGDS